MFSNVEVKILDPRAKLPQYGTNGSAGADLRVVLDEPLLLQPGETALVGTGLAIFVKDPNYVGLVMPRSGLGHKKGIVLGNLTGVIDSDYHGELKISLWNRSKDGQAVEIQPGDAVAQYLVVPVVQVGFEVVEEFSDNTTRGGGGFGHTGR